MGAGSQVYIESGAKRVFACSLEWPGLSRVAKDEQSALSALTAYAARYRVVAERAGVAFTLGPGGRRGCPWEVVGRVPTRSAGADFGVPTALVGSDPDPVTKQEAARTSALVEAAWTSFDKVVAAAPAVLRKGPRGGGRDRDEIVGHVAAAEQMFGGRVGLKLPVPPPGDRAVIEANRGAILDWCRNGTALPGAKPAWPPRYAARRLLWHVLDHTWEVEDRAVDLCPPVGDIKAGRQ
jgi:hypothetical protein